MCPNVSECAEIFNNYFSSAAIDLEVDRELFTEASAACDPVTIAIEKYKNHPSITRLKQKGFPNSNFSFNYISKDEIIKLIQNLDVSKAYQKDDIPPKILKENKGICSMILINDVCRCIDNGTFPTNLKSADITPTFKKADRLLKNNYSPIYEKIFYIQIYEFFNSIFSKYLCGFRKGHSIQHCLLYMLESIRRNRSIEGI